MGDPDKVAAKVSASIAIARMWGVLQRRSRSPISPPHWSAGTDRMSTAWWSGFARRGSRRRYAAAVNAGTAEDHVGRFRRLAESGAETAIVAMPDLPDVEAVERFARSSRRSPDLRSGKGIVEQGPLGVGAAIPAGRSRPDGP